MNITKQGIANFSSFNEYYIEPDGSKWIHVFHHNNPTEKKFNSTDTFSNGVFLDSDRWINTPLLQQEKTHEFLFIQKDTATSTPVKYRWKQTKSPFSSVYADVAPGAVTHITSSGYSTSTTGGGIYILNSNTYMVIANSSNGNWWGAIGCWTAHGGGIPGYPNVVCTTGSIDLYYRSGDITSDSTWQANNFYEY